jgi:hypothetical protein
MIPTGSQNFHSPSPYIFYPEGDALFTDTPTRAEPPSPAPLEQNLQAAQVFDTDETRSRKRSREEVSENGPPAKKTKNPNASQAKLGPRIVISENARNTLNMLTDRKIVTAKKMSIWVGIAESTVGRWKNGVISTISIANAKIINAKLAKPKYLNTKLDVFLLDLESPEYRFEQMSTESGKHIDQQTVETDTGPVITPKQGYIMLEPLQQDLTPKREFSTDAKPVIPIQSHFLKPIELEPPKGQFGTEGRQEEPQYRQIERFDEDGMFDNDNDDLINFLHYGANVSHDGTQQPIQRRGEPTSTTAESSTAPVREVFDEMPDFFGENEEEFFNNILFNG